MQGHYFTKMFHIKKVVQAKRMNKNKQTNKQKANKTIQVKKLKYWEMIENNQKKLH